VRENEQKDRDGRFERAEQRADGKVSRPVCEGSLCLVAGDSGPTYLDDWSGRDTRSSRRVLLLSQPAGVARPARRPPAARPAAAAHLRGRARGWPPPSPGWPGLLPAGAILRARFGSFMGLNPRRNGASSARGNY